MGDGTVITGGRFARAARLSLALGAAAAAAAATGCRFDEGGVAVTAVPRDGAGSDRSLVPQDGGSDQRDPRDGAADRPRPADWLDPAWGQRKKLVVSPTMIVGGQDLPGFVLLVRLVGADLAAHARPDGHDFVFTTGDGQTRLPHEVQSFDLVPGGRELMAWVRLPLLSASAGAELYLYYGNPTAAVQARPELLWWPGGYEAVWHLYGDPTREATGKHQCTVRGAPTDAAGVIAGGTEFDGVDDALDAPPFDVVADNDHDDGLTLEAWVYYSSGAGRVVSKATGDATADHFWMLDIADGVPRFRLKLQHSPGTTKTEELIASSAMIVADEDWIHLAATYDGAQMRIYLEGVSIAEQAATGTIATDGTVGVAVGAQPPDAGDRWFDGLLDEVRISRVGRTAGWIGTQYNNVKTPFENIAIADE